MDVLDHNRVLLAELLDKHLPAAHYTPPQASFLAWIDFRDLGWGDGGGGGVLLRSVQVAAVAEASADPAQSGQQFTDDERETVRRQIGRVRAAAD
jgi:bifunctional pyridoxal-dependent enzyme with beta-cystathionase and maltose regulon repressor activities